MPLDALSLREIVDILQSELAGCAKVIQAGEDGQADAELRVTTQAVEDVVAELERRGYRIVRGAM